MCLFLFAERLDREVETEQNKNVAVLKVHYHSKQSDPNFVLRDFYL